MQFHSGKTSTATVDVGGTPQNLPTTRWAIEPTSEMVRFRNSLTGTFDVKELTFEDLTGTVDVDFDFDNEPFAPSLNLNAGQQVSNLRLYVRNTGNNTAPAGPHWFVPYALITRTPQSTETGGKPTTQIAFTNSGPFYWVPAGQPDPTPPTQVT